MYQENYVSFDQAKRLKEFGFDWPVYQYYLINGLGDVILWFPEGERNPNNNDDDDISAPTLDQDKSFHIGFYQNFNDNRDGLEMVNGEIIRITYVSAPTLAQVQKWLRETKESEVIVIRLDDNVYNYTIYGEIGNVTTERTFDTYEQALSAGIDKALELLK